ncbi:MAG: hypothetical protein ACM3US_07245 [Sphingomonadaceae bacterium]
MIGDIPSVLREIQAAESGRPDAAAAQAAARRIVEAAQRHGVPVGEGAAVAQMAGMYVQRVPDSNQEPRR